MTEKTKVATLPQTDKALAKIRVVTDAAIKKMGKAYMAMTTKGVEDKESFEAVHAARLEVKGVRVELEKRRKAAVEDANKYLGEVNGEARRIKEMLTPIEDHLTEQEKLVTDEKKRLKEEKLKKQQEELQAKIKRLFDAGYKFDGVRYSISAEGTDFKDSHVLHDVVQKADDTFLDTYIQSAVDIKAALKIANEKAEAEKKKEKEEKAAEEQKKDDELRQLREKLAGLEKKEPVQVPGDPKSEPTKGDELIDDEIKMIEELIADIVNIQPRPFKVKAYAEIQERVFVVLQDAASMLQVETVFITDKVKK